MNIDTHIVLFTNLTNKDVLYDKFKLGYKAIFTCYNKDK